MSTSNSPKTSQPLPEHFTDACDAVESFVGTLRRACEAGNAPKVGATARHMMTQLLNLVEYAAEEPLKAKLRAEKEA